MFRILREDLRHCGDNPAERFRQVVFNPGMWAVFSYRFRRWIYLAPALKPFRLIFNPLISCVQLFTLVLTNIDLPTTAEIGPGLYIPHTGMIVVSKHTRIGSHCIIAQGVTIGHGGGGRSSADQSPVLGDRVYVGPSSVVIGPIEIADDVLIGAGAIVIGSVPPGGVVVGNPARLISRQGSFDLVTYSGMESDPDRAAALARLRSTPAGKTGASETFPHREIA